MALERQQAGGQANAEEDLDSLNQLESSFYKAGYDAGYEHGQAHGIFEGRALGQEKGFEVWEELGYYLGQARFWKEVVSKEDSPKKKALQHIEQLLYLIQQFPGSAESTTQHSDQDVQGLMQQIRLRYRMMCSALGVRPRVHTATMSI